MEEYPSGQRGQTVNLLASPSMVRIHPPPPHGRKHGIACGHFFQKPAHSLRCSASPRQNRLTGFCRGFLCRLAVFQFGPGPLISRFLPCRAPLASLSVPDLHTYSPFCLIFKTLVRVHCLLYHSRTSKSRDCGLIFFVFFPKRPGKTDTTCARRCTPAALRTRFTKGLHIAG